MSLATMPGEQRVLLRSITASEVLTGFPVDQAVATLNAIGSASETELIRSFVDKLQ